MAKNTGSGGADTQPEAVNESAAIGLDDLTQENFGHGADGTVMERQLRLMGLRGTTVLNRLLS
jgi:hypothetical protein